MHKCCLAVNHSDAKDHSPSPSHFPFPYSSPAPAPAPAPAPGNLSDARDGTDPALTDDLPSLCVHHRYSFHQLNLRGRQIY